MTRSAEDELDELLQYDAAVRYLTAHGLALPLDREDSPRSVPAEGTD